MLHICDISRKLNICKLVRLSTVYLCFSQNGVAITQKSLLVVGGRA